MNPAAVLSILVQAQGVQATTGQLNNLNSAAKTTSGGLSKVAKTAAVGLAAGVGAGALAVKGLIKAASESQVSSAKMQAQLKASGISYRAHAKEIDKVIQKHSALAGVDDEDLQDAFTTIVRSTGNVNAAMKDMGLVTDLARGKNMNLAKAGDLLAKVHNGNVGALKRMGIAIEPVTKAQDALKESSKKATSEQKKAAKAADQAATAQKGIAELQKRFGGQAEAYGKTAAGAQERFGVAVENLQETLGSKLLPIVTKVANGIADFVNGMSTGEGAGGRFVAILKGVATAFSDVWGWAQKNKTVLMDIALAVGIVTAAWELYRGVQIASAAATTAMATAQGALNAVMAANPVTLIVLALAALAAGLVLAYKHSETFRDIVNGAFDAIKSVAVPVVEWLAHAIPDAWNTIKDATTALWDWIAPYLTTAFSVIKTAVTTYFKAYWAIIQGAWTAIKTVTTTLWGWFGPYIKLAFEIVKTAVVVYFQIFKAVIQGVWAAIKTLTLALWEWFGPYVKAAWAAIKTAAGVAWGLIKFAIINPIKEAKAVIGGIWDDIKGAAEKAWDKITGAAGTFAGGLKDKISGAFRDAANLVVGFVNQIIDVVNKIPGVHVDKIKGISGPGSGSNAAARTGAGDVKLARGGAFGRTGGLVRSPITLMGEEAPRYPEFVIPTNPAYRGRARGLLAQAAGTIGLAAGGVWSKNELKNLWSRVNPGLGDPNLMAAIALAESSGDQNARNPSGAAGLWQILGLPFPGNPLDPTTNARMAGSKLRSQGLGAWEVYTSGAYKQFLGGGVLGKIGDLLSSLNPLDLIGKLPGAGSLPDWLKGLGKNVLGSVGGFIKSHLFGSGGGGGGGNITGLVPQVKAALAFARAHGWTGSVTSGYRSDAEQVRIWNSGIRPAAKPRSLGGPGSNHSLGQAVDVTDIPGFARAMAMMSASARLYSRVPGDPVHFSVTGLRKGGVLGSYKNGTPFVPQTGLYKLHRGETVIPYAAGGVTKGKTVPFPKAPPLSPLQQALYLKKLQDFIKAQAPPAKGLPMGASPTVVAAVAEIPGAAELTDAVSDNTQALEDQRKQWEAQIAADYQRQFNVSQSQYAILAQAVTDVVSVRMGSTLGLGLSGLRAAAGSVARV